MNKIRVSKELLINLGNYSNVKIIVEITDESERPFDKIWGELNEQIAQQEAIERARLAPKPQSMSSVSPKGPTPVPNDIW